MVSLIVNISNIVYLLHNKHMTNLRFMAPCLVNIFQYISNKMHLYTVYLYLEIALQVSGGTSTHHQERIQLYLQHLVFVTPLLRTILPRQRWVAVTV